MSEKRRVVLEINDIGDPDACVRAAEELFLAARKHHKNIFDLFSGRHEEREPKSRHEGREPKSLFESSMDYWKMCTKPNGPAVSVVLEIEDIQNLDACKRA